MAQTASRSLAPAPASGRQSPRRRCHAPPPSAEAAHSTLHLTSNYTPPAFRPLLSYARRRGLSRALEGVVREGVRDLHPPGHPPPSCPARRNRRPLRPHRVTCVREEKKEKKERERERGHTSNAAATLACGTAEASTRQAATPATTPARMPTPNALASCAANKPARPDEVLPGGRIRAKNIAATTAMPKSAAQHAHVEV